MAVINEGLTPALSGVLFYTIRPFLFAQNMDLRYLFKWGQKWGQRQNKNPINCCLKGFIW